MTETPSSTIVSTKLERIAKLAREAPDRAFTTLAHHIDIVWLHEAFRRTRKDGATGVDRQTAEEYAANLEGNLRSLLDRAKSGTRSRLGPRRLRFTDSERRLLAEKGKPLGRKLLAEMASLATPETILRWYRLRGRGC